MRHEKITGNSNLSINKALLAPSHIHSFPYYLWLHSCHKGRVESLWVTIWPVKPEIFTIWLFTECLPTTKLDEY